MAQCINNYCLIQNKFYNVFFSLVKKKILNKFTNGININVIFILHGKFISLVMKYIIL